MKVIAVNELPGHLAIEIAEKLALKFPVYKNAFWQKFQMQQLNTHLPLENCSSTCSYQIWMVEDGFKSRRYAQFGWSWTHCCYPHWKWRVLLQYGIRMKACRSLIAHQLRVVSVISTITWFHHWLLVVGSHGHNSVSHNVSSFDLSWMLKHCQLLYNNSNGFRVPPKIFEKD